jgi:hypothetical protein
MLQIHLQLWYFIKVWLIFSVVNGQEVNIKIMKRKFKQWWSTIPPIATKQTITSRFNSLNNKKERTTKMWHCLICQGDPKNNTFSKWYINTSCHKTFTHLVMDKPYYITHVQYFLLKYPYIKYFSSLLSFLTN